MALFRAKTLAEHVKSNLDGYVWGCSRLESQNKIGSWSDVVDPM